MNRNPLLPISLDRSTAASLQDQLAQGLKHQILRGVIPAGQPLPSSREIARDLGISRNTVIAACDRLLGEGYLEAAPRSGLFVTQQLGGRDTRSSHFPVKRPSTRIRRPVIHFPLVHAIPFRPCRPDVRLFPVARWNRHRTQALKTYGSSLFQYQPPCALGLPALRQELAHYLSESRGVQCNWTQIVVTSGSQQALFLLSQLILKPHDRVMVEDPGYPGARSVFSHSQVKFSNMIVDDHGAVPVHCRSRVKLIYTTPSRQFPTGACMPIARRMEMLQFAQRLEAWLIEDDYDSEFRYTRPPLPSLHSLADSTSVIYLGTMSKVLCPTLRIGYIVLPNKLVEPFEKLRTIVDDQGPLIDQATLAFFLASGEYYSHIRKCRKAYASRLDAFLTACSRYHLPLRFPHTDGGMNQAGFFDDKQTNDVMVSDQLGAQGYEIPALSQYSSSNSVSGLLFGFTAFDEGFMDPSISQLAKTMNKCVD